MFKQITIILLSDCNPIYDWNLGWQQKNSFVTQYKDNQALLTDANITPSGYVNAVARQYDLKAGDMIALPVHYRMTQYGVVAEILGDISKKHYHTMPEILADYLILQNDKSEVFWRVNEEGAVRQSPHPLQGKITNMQQEVEMALFQHPINVARQERQLRTITGIWVAKVTHPRLSKEVVSHSDYMSIIQSPRSLEQWYESPQSATLVLGEEVGDREISTIKHILEYMLENGSVRRVKVVSGARETIYSANLFDYWYAKCQLRFLKQAI